MMLIISAITYVYVPESTLEFPNVLADTISQLGPFGNKDQRVFLVHRYDDRNEIHHLTSKMWGTISSFNPKRSPQQLDRKL